MGRLSSTISFLGIFNTGGLIEDMHPRVKKILFSEDEIASKVKELAR